MMIKANSVEEAKRMALSEVLVETGLGRAEIEVEDYHEQIEVFLDDEDLLAEISIEDKGGHEVIATIIIHE